MSSYPLIRDKCKSVIVFAKRVPLEPLYASSCVPYTYTNTIVAKELDHLTFQLLLKLDETGIRGVPIPSGEPYEYWIQEETQGRAILSLRHAGYCAGLGVLGKNTLLINHDFGNMIRLGAILVDSKLAEDPIADYNICSTACEICLKSCPQSALDGITVNQKLCRQQSNYRIEKGFNLTKCNICRKVSKCCRNKVINLNEIGKL